MSYADKTLSCRDCGSSFTFTEGEQQFFAEKGFTNEPSRCPECRAARKSQRGSEGSYSSGGYSSGGYSSGGGYGQASRGPREMFSATCSECGQEARVPFQPTSSKPVYCSSCFERQRGSRY